MVSCEARSSSHSHSGFRRNVSPASRAAASSRVTRHDVKSAAQLGLQKLQRVAEVRITRTRHLHQERELNPPIACITVAIKPFSGRPRLAATDQVLSGLALCASFEMPLRSQVVTAHKPHAAARREHGG
eukprot:CAMPEP_0179146462 /NCGR_PEP_ID=MMETSP0796-20121207/70722_1 /TAXON_ID=73915 /ORGANISM="Pyrodinium bahamense, Strain pbaha01" /LENGTH=128 /DNA_ID=CAMNT_0020846933 /DNA_START=274 /DNA_END=656 /DNA_ORIENTATION=+